MMTKQTPAAPDQADGLAPGPLRWASVSILMLVATILPDLLGTRGAQEALVGAAVAAGMGLLPALRRLLPLRAA